MRIMGFSVALLTEGVDRNLPLPRCLPSPGVALLTEGVDRNVLSCLVSSCTSEVALLTEGVDRNCLATRSMSPPSESPSSRRAWIEIHHWCQTKNEDLCRPPHGGRG